MKINSNSTSFGSNLLVGSVSRKDPDFFNKMTQQIETAQKIVDKLKQSKQDVFLVEFHITDERGHIKPDCSTHILTDGEAKPLLDLDSAITGLKKLFNNGIHSDILELNLQKKVELIRNNQLNLAEFIIQKTKSLKINIP